VGEKRPINTATAGVTLKLFSPVEPVDHPIGHSLETEILYKHEGRSEKCLSSSWVYTKCLWG
jgi:hypothetical protein